MACEWDKYPMGTVDVNPGWNVQMLCPIANVIAEQQICRPDTWYIGGNANLSGEADTSAKFINPDFIDTMSGSSTVSAVNS